MLIVGIIGPYISGFNRRLIDNNIANARYMGIKIANRFKETKLIGFFIPHTHTAQFEALAEADEAYYHALDNEIYDGACKAFVLLPGWKISNGAMRDHKRATEQGKQIFELKSYEENDILALLYELESWARNFKDDRCAEEAFLKHLFAMWREREDCEAWM